jgi:hypothetical protein
VKPARRWFNNFLHLLKKRIDWKGVAWVNVGSPVINFLSLFYYGWEQWRGMMYAAIVLWIFSASLILNIIWPDLFPHTGNRKQVTGNSQPKRNSK